MEASPGERRLGIRAAASPTRRRVVLVHDIIPPYRVPLLEAISAHPRIDLLVLFMARTAVNRAWRVPRELGFAHAVLPGLHIPLQAGAYTLHFNPPVAPALLRFDPDAIVVGGWDLPTAFLAALVRNLGRSRQLVLWTESN